MTRWKYDADQSDPLTALRIPVTSEFPDFWYTACFDKYSAVRPTEAEARMIASFIEHYQERTLGNGWHRKQQLEQPFDLDCRTTTVFHKWARDDWSYRCVRWTSGAFWVPVAPRIRNTEYDRAPLKGPLPLVRVMDSVRHDALSWTEWKAARPAVFPTEGETT